MLLRCPMGFARHCHRRLACLFPACLFDSAAGPGVRPAWMVTGLDSLATQGRAPRRRRHRDRRGLAAPPEAGVCQRRERAAASTVEWKPTTARGGSPGTGGRPFVRRGVPGAGGSGPIVPTGGPVAGLATQAACSCGGAGTARTRDATGPGSTARCGGAADAVPACRDNGATPTAGRDASRTDWHAACSRGPALFGMIGFHSTVEAAARSRRWHTPASGGAASRCGAAGRGGAARRGARPCVARLSSPVTIHAGRDPRY